MRTHTSESTLSIKIVLLFSHLQKHLWHSCFKIPFWAKLLKTLDHTVVLNGLRTPSVDTFEVCKDAHEIVNGVSCKERTFKPAMAPNILAAGWTGKGGANFRLERTNVGLPAGHRSVHSCWTVCTPTVPAFRCFHWYPKEEASFSAIEPASMLLKCSAPHTHWFRNLTPSSFCTFDPIWLNTEPLLRATYCAGAEMQRRLKQSCHLSHNLSPRISSSSLISYLSQDDCLWKTIGSFQKSKFPLNEQHSRKFSGGEQIKFCVASEDSSTRRKSKVFGAKMANKIIPWLPRRLRWDYYLLGV